MFVSWAIYQDVFVHNNDTTTRWDALGNAFTDPYLKMCNDITIHPVRNCWPETYMISDENHRQFKYEDFYFNKKYHLSDIRETDMLMLHNSWTPDWYKKFNEEDVLNYDCTLSNILREVA